MISVQKISYSDAKPWILYKHYAKRIPPIVHLFGLYQDNILEGVCTFGSPPNRSFNDGACVFRNLKMLVYELNRLVVSDGLPKNSLSFFVSQSLGKLPTPCCVVSYADENKNHYGYIYQATNWIYTGVSTPKHKYIFADGSTFDSRRRGYSKGKIVDKIRLKPSHRYITFVGSKKDKKNMSNALKMTIKPYPKGKPKRYDASYQPNVQMVMF